VEVCVKSVVTHIVGESEGGGGGKYLGFPFVVGRNKKTFLNSLR